MNTATSSLLEYLKSEKSITSMEAFQMFGITRLSGRIFDLRNRGYNIDTIMMEGTTRYNMPCRYAKYVYKGESNE